MVNDLSGLQKSLFTDQGSVSEMFDDAVVLFMDLRAVIEGINRNAVAARTI